MDVIPICRYVYDFWLLQITRWDDKYPFLNFITIWFIGFICNTTRRYDEYEKPSFHSEYSSCLNKQLRDWRWMTKCLTRVIRILNFYKMISTGNQKCWKYNICSANSYEFYTPKLFKYNSNLVEENLIEYDYISFPTPALNLLAWIEANWS